MKHLYSLEISYSKILLKESVSIYFTTKFTSILRLKNTKKEQKR